MDRVANWRETLSSLPSCTIENGEPQGLAAKDVRWIRYEELTQFEYE